MDPAPSPAASLPPRTDSSRLAALTPSPHRKRCTFLRTKWRTFTCTPTAAEALGSANVAVVACDNADPDTPELLTLTAKESFGRLDGLLLSVGGPPAGSVTAASDEQWRNAFESVFLGSVRLAREVAAKLPAGGSIALVLSSSVRTPIAELGISNGLRPGLAMVAKTMASQFGPSGIRINGLLPGRIATDRLKYLEAASSPESRQAALAGIPLDRPGGPDEFGRVAAFLLSPAASYLTGVMLPVDGGAIPAL